MPIWLKPPKSFVRRKRMFVPSAPAPAGHSLTPFKSHSHVQKKNKFFAEIMRLKRRRRFSLSAHTSSSVFNKSHGAPLAATITKHKHDFFGFVMNLKRKRQRFSLSAHTSSSVYNKSHGASTIHHRHDFFQFVMNLKRKHQRFSLSAHTVAAPVSLTPHQTKPHSVVQPKKNKFFAEVMRLKRRRLFSLSQVVRVATSSVTQADMTGTATATVAIAASGSQTQAAMTGTATATVAIAASGSQTQAAMTGVATAVTGSGPSAQSTITQADMTGVATVVSDSSPDFIGEGWTPDPAANPLASWAPDPAPNSLASEAPLATNPLARWTPDPVP